jgi:hypothetical protein
VWTGIEQGDEKQMERRTPVFIVCSPLPNVGKTLLARLLAEYFRDDKRTFAAFDINPDDFALAQQLPDHTSIAHIGDTKGQMALFDQLISRTRRRSGRLASRLRSVFNG